MSLISKKTHCFNCNDGSMIRDAANDSFYTYRCDTCGAYSEGLMSGYYGTQYYKKDGSKAFSDNGERVNKHD